MEEKSNFNYKEFEDEAIKRLQDGAPLEGKDGVLGPLIKRLMEAGLNGEMDAHLIQSQFSNRCNGKTGKQVKTAFGKVDINTPRDRNSTFKPQLLPKRQTTLGEGGKEDQTIWGSFSANWGIRIGFHFFGAALLLTR